MPREYKRPRIVCPVCWREVSGRKVKGNPYFLRPSRHLDVRPQRTGECPGWEYLVKAPKEKETENEP